MTLLAIDLGSHMGLAWRAGERVVSQQVLLPQGAGMHGLRCFTAALKFREIIQAVKPAGVVYEIPPSIRGYHASRCLFGLEGVLLTVCEDLQIVYCSVAARAVKAALAGSPSADKAACLRGAMMATGRWVATEDEADAVGVLLVGEQMPPKTWG